MDNPPVDASQLALARLTRIAADVSGDYATIELDDLRRVLGLVAPPQERQRPLRFLEMPDHERVVADRVVAVIRGDFDQSAQEFRAVLVLAGNVHLPVGCLVPEAIKFLEDPPKPGEMQ